MRLTVLCLSLLLVGCSDDANVVQRPAPPEPGRRRATPEVGVSTPTGTVHTVEVRAAGGEYRFIPASLAIKQGDAVRWVAYDSPPHNVAFFPNRIPANATQALQSVMMGTRGLLAGPFILEEGDWYEVQFVNVPAGQYSYRCERHAAQDMTGTIIVEP